VQQTSSSSNLQPGSERLRRIGVLLLAGIHLAAEQGASSHPATVVVPARQTANATVRLIREAFASKPSWTPAALRRQAGLTAYQTKTALRRLQEDGYLTVDGKTRSAIYTRVDHPAANWPERRRSA
jgi:hypothetical protein